jgi:hypothetical protein
VELVVIRTDSGISPEENLRDEIIAALSFNDLPHSKLKAAIPEKGLKAQEVQNKCFDRILSEVKFYLSLKANNFLRWLIIKKLIKAKINKLNIV